MTSKAKFHKQLQLNCTSSVSYPGQPPESSREGKVGGGGRTAQNEKQNYQSKDADSGFVKNMPLA